MPFPGDPGGGVKAREPGPDRNGLAMSASEQEGRKRQRPAAVNGKAVSVWDLDNLDAESLRQLQGEQLDRFEAYRRSAIPRATMKKLLTAVTGQTPDVPTTIVACGVAKLLVGELVDAGRRAKAEGRREGGEGDPADDDGVGLNVDDLRRAFALTMEETQLPLRRKRERLL